MNKATVIAQDHDRLGELYATLRNAGPGMEIESVIGGANQLVEEIGRQGASLILTSSSEMTTDEQEAIETVLAKNPRVAVVMVTDDQSPEFLMWAMRCGIAEIVPATAEPVDVLRAVTRQVKRRGNATVAKSERKGSVVAFLPSKGGSGATFLATNAAAMLASRGKKVALIDLNLHMGEAALYMCDEPPTKSIADVATDAERIDDALVQASMVQTSENLWLLAAPETPEAAMEVQPDAVARVIEVLRSQYEYVVIDTGRVLDARSLAGLDAADTIHLVMQLAVPYVHDAKRLKHVFDGLGYPASKLRLVVNRYERGTDVSVRDVEKALGAQVAVKVPNDFKTVTYAINHALPIFKHKKRNPVSEAIGEIANMIAPSTKRRSVIGSLKLKSATASRG